MAMYIRCGEVRTTACIDCLSLGMHVVVDSPRITHLSWFTANIHTAFPDIFFPTPVTTYNNSFIDNYYICLGSIYTYVVVLGHPHFKIYRVTISRAAVINNICFLYAFILW